MSFSSDPHSRIFEDCSVGVEVEVEASSTVDDKRNGDPEEGECTYR